MALSQYEGANTFHEDIQVAENGDGTSTFWEKTARPLIDRTMALAGPRRRRVHGDTITGTTDSGATPSLSPGAKRFTSSGAIVVLYPDLPVGYILDAIELDWKGAAGHGSLPTMPTLAFKRIAADGTVSTIATATDSSASIAEYEAQHSIKLSGMAHTIASTYSYVIVITNESGGGYVSGAGSHWIDY